MVGGGRMIEASKYVGTWRDDVKAAALQAAATRGAAKIDGPLALRLTFTLPRPKSAAKKRLWPTGPPDLSKLIRSTEDAITTAGLWADDARVVSVDATKVWTGHPLALPNPGAVVAAVGLDGVGEWLAAVELRRLTHLQYAQAWQQVAS